MPAMHYTVQLAIPASLCSDCLLHILLVVVVVVVVVVCVCVCVGGSFGGLLHVRALIHLPHFARPALQSRWEPEGNGFQMDSAQGLLAMLTSTLTSLGGHRMSAHLGSAAATLMSRSSRSCFFLLLSTIAYVGLRALCRARSRTILFRTRNVSAPTISFWLRGPPMVPLHTSPKRCAGNSHDGSRKPTSRLAGHELALWGRSSAPDQICTSQRHCMQVQVACRGACRTAACSQLGCHRCDAPMVI